MRITLNGAFRVWPRERITVRKIFVRFKLKPKKKLRECVYASKAKFMAENLDRFSSS